MTEDCWQSYVVWMSSRIAQKIAHQCDEIGLQYWRQCFLLRIEPQYDLMGIIKCKTYE